MLNSIFFKKFKLKNFKIPRNKFCVDCYRERSEKDWFGTMHEFTDGRMTDACAMTVALRPSTVKRKFISEAVHSEVLFSFYSTWFGPRLIPSVPDMLLPFQPTHPRIEVHLFLFLSCLGLPSKSHRPQLQQQGALKHKQHCQVKSHKKL